MATILQDHPLEIRRLAPQPVRARVRLVEFTDDGEDWEGDGFEIQLRPRYRIGHRLRRQVRLIVRVGAHPGLRGLGRLSCLIQLSRLSIERRRALRVGRSRLRELAVRLFAYA